jgi:hypothetical protein
MVYASLAKRFEDMLIKIREQNKKKSQKSSKPELPH